MKKFILFSLTLFMSFFSFSKIIKEKIEIQNGFYSIPAIYTYDNSIKNQPIVIMLHGTASNKDEVGDTYIKMADSLIKKGISSIRFDFIGTGDSKVDYMQYTLTSAVSDTNKVIEFARTKTKGNIGILGWSQGGSIALLAGSNKEIKSIATWAAALDLTDEFGKEYEEAKKNGFALETFSWRDPLRVSLQWFNEVRHVNIIDYVKTIKAPIMALAGTNDEDVDPKCASIIVKNSKNKKSKVVMIKDSNHIFNLFTDNLKVNEGLKVTTDWFVKTLK